MQRIIVKNFGPLKDIDLDLKDFMVFIGPNASGKSTLVKLIYFFLKVPESIINAYVDSFQKSKEEQIGIVHRSFWSFFNYGFPVEISQNAYIKFIYNSEISILFEPEKEVITFPFNIKFSGKFEGVLIYIDTLRDFFENKLKSDQKLSIDFTKLKYDFRDEVKHVINLEFNNIISLKKYYFPEGRASINVEIEGITSIQNDFRNLIKDSQYLLNDILDRGISFDEIKNIIGGKLIKIDSSRYGLELESGEKIPYYFLSSGQKEVFWLLVSLFLIRKKDEPNFIFIEELETHLFPNKQKDFIYFLVKLFNLSKSKIILNTHSHYILGALNILINANRIGSTHFEKVRNIIPKELWLDREKVFAGYLNNGILKNIYDESAEMYNHDYLTKVSSELNENFDDLMDIEFETEKDEK